jgi:TPR repeat protein
MVEVAKRRHSTKVFHASYSSVEPGIKLALLSPDDWLKVCVEAISGLRRPKDGRPLWIVQTSSASDVRPSDGNDGTGICARAPWEWPGSARAQEWLRKQRLAGVVSAMSPNESYVKLESQAWGTSVVTADGRRVDTLEVQLRFFDSYGFGGNRIAEQIVSDTVKVVEQEAARAMALRDSFSPDGSSTRYQLIQGWWIYPVATARPGEQRQERWLGNLRIDNSPILIAAADWVDTARDYLAGAGTAAPQSAARYRNDRAAALERQGRFDDAEGEYCTAAGSNVGAAAGWNGAMAARLLERRRQLQGAEKWYRFAVDAGYAPAAAHLGRLLRQRGALHDAETWYRRAAESGDTDAMVHLGALMERERRIPDEDGVLRRIGGGARERQAQSWYRKAVEAGHNGAMTALARSLHSGGQSAEAEDWYRKAVAGDDVAAMTGLGELLVDQGHLADAEQWLRRAADSGDPLAMTLLGVKNLLEGESGTAEDWLCQASVAGDFDAMTCLGKMLWEREEFDEGLSWVRKAAAGGNVAAMASLGSMLCRRGAVEEAERWLRKAAINADHEAMANLADLLERQGAVAEARHWRDLAGKFFSVFESEQRGTDEPAQAFYADGEELYDQNDFAGAAAAFQHAAVSGHPEWAPRAAINLGILRENFLNDVAGAGRAYQQVIDSGHRECAPKAAMRLGVLRETKLNDVVGAAAAYQIAIDSGQPDLAAMAANNLKALEFPFPSPEIAGSQSRAPVHDAATPDKPTSTSKAEHPPPSPHLSAEENLPRRQQNPGSQSRAPVHDAATPDKPTSMEECAGPRVHELAKELGVTSKHVLARLFEQGEIVKSASSRVEEPVAERIRESFGGTRRTTSQ